MLHRLKVLLLVALFAFSLSVALAQDALQTAIPLTIFVDKDSLTIYASLQNNISLKGFTFQVQESNGEIKTYPLFDSIYLAFGVLENSMTTPICLRFVRDETSPTAPTECNGILVVTQKLNSANVFWYDDLASQTRTIVLSRNDAVFAIFPAGQNRLDVLFPAPPVPIITVTPPPSLTPTPPIPPTATIAATSTPSLSVDISIIFATESDYLFDVNNPSADSVINRFNALACRDQNPINPVSGQPLTAKICITGKERSSGQTTQAIINAINNPTTVDIEKPTIFQPSVSDWLRLINHETDQEIYTINDPFTDGREGSRATTREPLILATWQSRYDAIQRTRGLSREQIGWAEFRRVQESANGWCDYGLPNCRRAVLMGFTDPNISSTALSMLTGQFYAGAGSLSTPLTLDQINNQTIQSGVNNIQRMARHYSASTVTFRNYLIRGPEYLDFVPLDENSLIFINKGKAGAFPPEPLIALYPPEGTFFHERPMGIANANWVTPDQRLAAQLFVDYVLTEEIQRFIMSWGFRPANQAVQLDNTFWGGCPNVTQCGVIPTSPTTILPSVSGAVTSAIQDSWTTVKRQASVILAIDTSGSMSCPPEKLDRAKLAAESFLNQLDDNVEIGLVTFNAEVDSFPIAPLISSKEDIRAEIRAIEYRDCNLLNDTALYQALFDSYTLFGGADDNRIHAIVLLSDGADTEGRYLPDQILTQIQNDWKTSANPVVILPIAYGSDADLDTLTRIANASFIVQPFQGDVDNINDLLQQIRTYF